MNLDFAMNWVNFPQMINQEAIDEMCVWVLNGKKNKIKTSMEGICATGSNDKWYAVGLYNCERY